MDLAAASVPPSVCGGSTVIDEKFVLLGALLSAMGSLSYLRDTITGKAQPNRVTWLLWAIVPFIALSAQLNENVGAVAIVTFMAGFSPLLIFLASFTHRNKWKVTKLDLTCGALSVTGIVLWQLTGDGVAAIAFSILADGLAAVPTIVKAYRHPETENWHVFALAMINAIIALLTVRTWDFTHYGFAAYVLVHCAILVILIAGKPGVRWRTGVTLAPGDTAA